MATMSERAKIRYVGDGPAMQLPDFVEAVPSTVASGGEVELNADAAAWLVTNAGDLWAPVGAAPDGVLTGKALTAALKAAGLPTTGTAAEKRARLVEHEAAQVESDDDGPNAPEVDPSSATDDDHTETDA